jgi:hypothetical protein
LNKKKQNSNNLKSRLLKKKKLMDAREKLNELLNENLAENQRLENENEKKQLDLEFEKLEVGGFISLYI